VEDVLGTAPNFGLPYSEMDVYNEGSYTDWPNLLLKNGLTQMELNVCFKKLKT
jgi:hypothetical protein